jgi:hypothetical protein
MLLRLALLRVVDLAYSPLELGDVKDVGRLFAVTWQALVAAAALYSRRRTRSIRRRTVPAGLTERRQTWLVDHYFAEGPWTNDWLVKGVVKPHRTLATRSPLHTRRACDSAVEEFRPAADRIAVRRKLAEERERPKFLLIAARRNELV